MSPLDNETTDKTDEISTSQVVNSTATDNMDGPNPSIGDLIGHSLDEVQAAQVTAEAAALEPTTPSKKPRGKKATAADKPTTPRKRTPAKKANMTGDDENAEAAEAKPTPKRRGPKPKKEATVPSSPAVDDEDAVTDDAGPSTPKNTSEKRAKKETGDETPAGTTPKSKGKKRAASVANEGENGDAEGTPTKKRGRASAIPRTYEELSNSDKRMVQLRKEGKTFNEISKTLVEELGEDPVKPDTLKARFRKINAEIVEWDQGDIDRMYSAKKSVDDEIAAAIKKIELERWNKISESMITNFNTKKYTGVQIETKYKQTVKEHYEPAVATPKVDGESPMNGNESTPALEVSRDQDMGNTEAVGQAQDLLDMKDEERDNEATEA